MFFLRKKANRNEAKEKLYVEIQKSIVKKKIESLSQEEKDCFYRNTCPKLVHGAIEKGVCLC